MLVTDAVLKYKACISLHLVGGGKRRTLRVSPPVFFDFVQPPAPARLLSGNATCARFIHQVSKPAKFDNNPNVIVQLILLGSTFIYSRSRVVA